MADHLIRHRSFAESSRPTLHCWYIVGRCGCCLWYFGFLFGETISHFPSMPLLHRWEKPFNVSAESLCGPRASRVAGSVDGSESTSVRLPQQADILTTRRKTDLMSHRGAPHRSGHEFSRRTVTTPPLEPLFRIGDRATCRRRTVTSSA